MNWCPRTLEKFLVIGRKKDYDRRARWACLRHEDSSRVELSGEASEHKWKVRVVSVGEHGTGQSGCISVSSVRVYLPPGLGRFFFSRGVSAHKGKVRVVSVGEHGTGQSGCISVFSVFVCLLDGG